MIAAVVPVQSLASSKSRLWSELGRDVVERLVLAMLADVVTALRAVDSLDRVAVVTPDPRVGDAARRLGACALVRADPGLNPSLEHVARELAPRAADGLLVMLGDVAGADPGEVEALIGALEALGGRGVVLAASRDGGTSALLRAPHDAIPSAFGADSAKAHRALVEARGVRFRELRLPSLAIDLDRSEDLADFLRTSRGGTHTRALLRDVGWNASQ